MKISNQLMLMLIGLVLLGYTHLEAAPVSDERVVAGPVVSAFTLQPESGGGTSLPDGWVPGKRVASPSFPRTDAGLERFIEPGDGLWAATPPLVTPVEATQVLRGPAGPDAHDAAGSIDPAEAVLAIAGFTPGLLADLLGSLTPKTDAPAPTAARLPIAGEAQIFLRNAVVLAALLAIAGSLALLGWWAVLAVRNRRRRVHPFRRYKVSGEQAIRGFVSPAMSPD